MRTIIILSQDYQDSFDDLDIEAQELSREKQLPVKFEYGGYSYTVETLKWEQAHDKTT